MRITALVEDQTKGELKAKHGLSLYIETKGHKILFDLKKRWSLKERTIKGLTEGHVIDNIIIRIKETSYEQ